MSKVPPLLQPQSTSPLQVVGFWEFIRFLFSPPNQPPAVDDMSPSENFSAVVQVGVVEAFRQQAQIVEVSKAGGSSAGALVAAAMLTGVPMESVMVQVVEPKGGIL